MKICNICQEEKPKEEFHKDCQKPDGHCYQCKKCSREKSIKLKEERSRRKVSPPATKICPSCGTEKSANSFHKDFSKLDFLQSKCKECHAKLSKKYNDRNKEILNEIKSGAGCVRCGIKDHRCLDFHHKDPSEKEFTIGKHGSRQIKKSLEEISKCEVLCANCHRILHAEEV